MYLAEKIKGRLHGHEILRLCAECRGECNDGIKADLLALINHDDDRIGYNALWIMTHFADDDIKWLRPNRDILIETLLITAHTGKRRLLLTLLERQSVTEDDIRTDYLDFCLSRINSAEPYGIRALCLKQAFAMCRFYPELLAELCHEIELMQYSPLSPGLICARKAIIKRIAALNS